MKKHFFKFTTILIFLTSTAVAQFTNPGDIVITEFMADPSVVTDASGEWFEILNITTNMIDINGWHIKDNGTDDHIINNGGPLELQPGTILVFANNGDNATNGGITPDYTYSGFTLANTGDEIILVDLFGIVIDSVAYTGTTSGKSWSLDPGHYNATDNDNFAYWCLSTTTYGMGDFGTPSAVNTTCSLNTMTLLMNDNGLSIRTIDNKLYVHLNAVVKIQEWDITDISGKIICSGITPEQVSNFSIPLDKITSGIYFFRIYQMGSALRFIIN